MNNNNRQNTTINWYPGHMAKTKRLIKENIHLIDVVYEVVDARIPYSSKIIDLDEYIKDKPRIMILSKYDLCDKIETQKWIELYEQKGYTVITFDLLHTSSVQSIIDCTRRIMQGKNEKRKEQGMNQKRMRALVVGIPNVGKSTLINRFARKKAAGVGNKPGITKNLHWIRMNEKIELLDTPGILWPKFTEETVALNLASLTAIKEEVLPLDKVVYYILETLAKFYPTLLEKRYGIKEREDLYTMIEEIGRRRGCLRKGGMIDEEKVYELIMNDIKEGHICGITFDRMEQYM